MIAYITGKVVSVEQNIAVIECAGIGYEIIVSTSTAAAISQAANAQIYTYMQVRDDGISLYGFNSMDEKGMFVKLIGVTGIGCKAAISIMSGIRTVDLAVSIANGDTAMLSTIKGIGKKTAARIILELKEKVSPFTGSGLDAAAFPQIADGSPSSEALEALAALGLGRAECTKAVLAAAEAGMQSTADIIGHALRNMGK